MGEITEIQERLRASRVRNPFHGLVLETLRRGNRGSDQWSHYDVHNRVWQILATQEIGHSAVDHMNLVQVFSKTIGVETKPWRRYTSQEMRDAINKKPGNHQTRDLSRLSQEMTTLVSRVLHNLAEEGFIDYKGQQNKFWRTQKPLPKE